MVGRNNSNMVKEVRLYLPLKDIEDADGKSSRPAEKNGTPRRFLKHRKKTQKTS